MLSDTPLILLFHRIHRAGLQLERLNLDVDPDDGIKELLEAIRDKLRSLGPRDQVRRQPLKLLRHDLRMIMISAFLPDERRRCGSESLTSLKMLIGATIACVRRASTLDDVRSYEPSLRTPGTLYLLDQIFEEKSQCLPSGRIREFEFLKLPTLRK